MKAGTVSITASYPSASSSSEKSVSYLSATLKKGSTLRLGAVLSDGKAGTAEWSSSKSSAASVSSSGKITAKAKGTAVITAKVDSSTVKIQIKVTE
ncbi:MAG: Ig-like domain-containing protein [Ruminiclostridium sp.]|nr:Ig-like domain-containing protein [Ruminiclostridium sp.]